MRKHRDGTLTYSPSDLVRFQGSPFATWMDRFALERPGVVTPDEADDQDRLVLDLRTTGPEEDAELARALQIAAVGG